ncbi:unnamed protein product [Pleuronectes platessa]|uniref:Uncharacterized protein n=1 Tax=Pleuronectes platessa TaxID=8262 RepID=A0A9N7USC7_PLEPL|nr:unnamed protein product [Pleuronectes platessa]
MPKCPNCQKEVYFAEKVSLWYRAHTQSVMESLTVTHPATATCLDLGVLAAVEPRATNINRQVQTSQ